MWPVASKRPNVHSFGSPLSILSSLKSQRSSTDRHIVSTSLNLVVAYFTLLPLKLNWISFYSPTNHYYYSSPIHVVRKVCLFGRRFYLCVACFFCALPCNNYSSAMYFSSLDQFIEFSLCSE